jgi:mRNA (2'-O-methyladenosine-N6-)-methyltransferase
MSPGGRKIEIFGRPHNTRPGWITLGNQLPGIYLKYDDIIKRFKSFINIRYQETYPD